MIKIEVLIDYPSAKPFSATEQERMAEAIRRVLQPALASACCNVRRDVEEGVEPDNVEFFNSTRLEIQPTITVIDDSNPYSEADSGAYGPEYQGQ